ncbi:hypothetical protein FDECE_1028 [Fusarium decemcellulare]|nr:hypothetical protein FDECE_1028 [Fusarium decemcellulare]
MAERGSRVTDKRAPEASEGGDQRLLALRPRHQLFDEPASWVAKVGRYVHGLDRAVVYRLQEGTHNGVGAPDLREKVAEKVCWILPLVIREGELDIKREAMAVKSSSGADPKAEAHAKLNEQKVSIVDSAIRQLIEPERKGRAFATRYPGCPASLGLVTRGDGRGWEVEERAEAARQRRKVFSRARKQSSTYLGSDASPNLHLPKQGAAAVRAAFLGHTHAFRAGSSAQPSDQEIAPSCIDSAPADHTRYLGPTSHAFAVGRVSHEGGPGSFLEADEPPMDDLPSIYAPSQPCSSPPITGKQGLHNAGLHGLLRMLTYGLNDVVSVARGDLTIWRSQIRENRGAPEPLSSPFLADTYDTVSCSRSMGFETAEAWRKEMCGRRFFAGTVCHYWCAHVTTFIFDRVRGQFYHFDTLAADQKVRLHHAVVAFRGALGWGGLPYEFDFFGIPLSPQPSSQDGGLLSIYCLFTTLRGLVGVGYGKLASISPPELLTVDGCGREPQQAFDLLIRDWVMDPWIRGTDGSINYVRATTHVKALYQRVILEEMGIMDGLFKTREGTGGQAIKYTRQGPNSRPVASMSHAQSPLLDINNDLLYTDSGGYMQFYLRSVGTARAWSLLRLLPYPGPGAGQYRVTAEGWTRPRFTPQQLADHLISRYTARGAEVRGCCCFPVQAPDTATTPSAEEEQVAESFVDTTEVETTESDESTDVDMPDAPDHMVGVPRGRTVEPDPGPVIEDASEIDCRDAAELHDGDNGYVGGGAEQMSVVPRDKLGLVRVLDRVTYRLSTGNIITHVPAGLIADSQWDIILAAAAAPFTALPDRKLSTEDQNTTRDERKKRRRW